MQEIAKVLAIIIIIILVIDSEQFRDIIKVGFLMYISYVLFHIYKVLV